MFLIGIFTIGLLLSISLYYHIKNKTKLAISFLATSFIVLLGLIYLAEINLNPTKNMLINEIIKEKPILTKKELRNLSNNGLKRLLSKLKEEKETKIMRAITEKINMEYMDDRKSMRDIPQRIEFY